MKKIYLKHKLPLILGLTCSLLYAAVSVGWAFAFQFVVDFVSDLNLRGSIISLGILTASSAALALLLFLDRFFMQKYIQKTLGSVKNKIFENYIRKGYSEFYENSEGDYLNTIIKLCSELRQQYIIPLYKIIGLLAMSLFAFAAVVYYHYLMGIVVLVLFGLQMLIPILQKKSISKTTDAYVKTSGEFSGTTQNFLGGFELILANNIQDKILSRFIISNEQYQKKYFTMQNIRNISGALVYLAQNIIIIIPWFVGAVLVIDGQITFGMLMAISQLNNRVSEPFSSAISLYNEYLGGREIARKIKEDMLAVSHLERTPLPFDNKFSSLTIKNICFAYKNKPVLNNVSLSFEKGKKYAIIGASGCGKSTLGKILGGLLTNYEGVMTVNDQEINARLHSIAHISLYSPQEAYLLDDTLRNNITLYSDTYSDSIEDVLKKLELDSFIKELPNGADTLLGSGGQLVSGGQKQRIGIARTLVNDAPLIILDEPTASLDESLKTKIEDLVFSMKDTTIISIIHRLNEDILKKYDSLIIMSDGKVVASGSFDEVMAKDCSAFDVTGKDA